MAFRGAVQRGLADWRFTVGVVSGGHFLSHFYKLAFPPLFPLLRPEFGASNVQLGLLMTALWAGSFLQAPIGVLVDRVGGKRMFLGAVGLTSLGVVLSGLAVSYYVIFAFALLSGLGQAVFHPADYALLDAATEGDNEGKSFGVHTFGGYVGFAAAPLVVGALAAAFDWRVALLAVGGAGVAYALFAGVVMVPVHRPRGTEESARDERSSLPERTRALLRPRVLVLAVFFAGLVMGQKGISTFTPLFVATQLGMTEAAGNSVLTAFFTAGAVGVLLGGIAADRYDPHLVAIATLTAGSAALAALVAGAVGTGAAVAFPLFAFVGLCYGLPLPSRDRLVSAASSGDVGTSFGVVFTAAAVGSFVSPTLLGAVIERSGTAAAFAAIALFFLAAAGVALLLKAGLVGGRTDRPVPGSEPTDGDDD
jgi:predicted MFS family arabinose efflux permease